MSAHDVDSFVQVSALSVGDTVVDVSLSHSHIKSIRETSPRPLDGYCHSELFLSFLDCKANISALNFLRPSYGESDYFGI